MTDYKIIRLRKGKEESLLRFHPWVFSGAIDSLPDGLEEGETVKVTSHDGTTLGTGHFQIGSIAVRMLSSSDETIDEAFYTLRLRQAWLMRKAIGVIRLGTDAYRLVHGEGDFLPGLVADVYGPTAVVQAHSPGMHFARDIIARALVGLPGAGISNVYYKSETTLPYKARLGPQNESS